MAQADLGTLEPATTPGTQLAVLLRNWRDAVHSTHAGAARPTYAVPGTLWIDTSASPWLLKLYTGSVDSIISTVNETTGEIELPIAPSGTLLGRTDAGTGPMEAIPFADLRNDLSDRPLLFAWSDGDLTGLTQIVENLPSGFSSYEFKITNIRAQSGEGALVFRCGDPSTGTIYSGASDYVSSYVQRRDTITEIGNETTNRVYAFPFNTTSGAQNITGTISIGGGDYWNIFLTGGFVHISGETTVTTRHSRFISGGDLRRLQIGFATALAGIGHIRIWGVR